MAVSPNIICSLADLPTAIEQAAETDHEIFLALLVLRHRGLLGTDSNGRLTLLHPENCCVDAKRLAAEVKAAQ